MQNKYVGDVGDFGKYGLLRFLSGLKEDSTSDPGLRLGVVWYLNPHDPHGTDGRLTRYLADSPINRSRFRDCDPPLYEALRQMVAGGDRNITAVQRRGVLPPDTTFYESPLPYTPGTSRPSRQANRENWLAGALEATIGSELVFFDPDNGVSEKADRFGKAGLKHVFVEEVRPFLERSQSLVIYHHLGRLGNAHQQIEQLRVSLRSSLDMLRRPLALWYRRGTARVYFIAAQERHESIIEARLKGFFGGLWRTHFQLVE